MLDQTIERFVRNPDDGDFDELALRAFEYQFERLPEFAALCRRRGLTPERISSWIEIPPIPTLAFKSIEPHVEASELVFRSSGTTGDRRSVHHHAFPGLYRATIEASFPANCLPAGSAAARVPMLSLVPPREQVPDSSLSFMVEHVIETWADDTSGWALGTGGVDARALRAWLAARQREGRPVVLLATALAVLDALQALDRLGLRFRLPAGSLLFETGGYKGRRTAVDRGQIEARLQSTIGLPANRIVREYGMTELTSQLYTATLAGGPPNLFQAPHWCRVRVLDPDTLTPVEDGRIGMVALFDLANLSSAIHLLTEDLGSLHDGALELHGRAAGAELRGCSLTAEELVADA